MCVLGGLNRGSAWLRYGPAWEQQCSMQIGYQSMAFITVFCLKSSNTCQSLISYQQGPYAMQCCSRCKAFHEAGHLPHPFGSSRLLARVKLFTQQDSCRPLMLSTAVAVAMLTSGRMQASVWHHLHEVTSSYNWYLCTVPIVHPYTGANATCKQGLSA